MIKTKKICEASGYSRVVRIILRKKEVLSPVYFPAISSVQVRYPFETYVNLLVNKSYPRLLVSCYDLYAKSDNNLFAVLNKYSKEGNLVFLDSGIYESYWKNDENWSFDKYNETASRLNCDLYTSFDILPNGKRSNSSFLEELTQIVFHSSKVKTLGEMVPIIHGRTQDNLMEGVAKVMDNLAPSVLAIPERETGETLEQRIMTLTKIRKLVNEVKSETLIHLLGCGDPLSLVLYILCGVDSFDSLDWVKFAIDPKELRTRHSAHISLIECNCPACSTRKYDPPYGVWIHNLFFYEDFMEMIRNKICKGTMENLITRAQFHKIFETIQEVVANANHK